MRKESKFKDLTEGEVVELCKEKMKEKDKEAMKFLTGIGQTPDDKELFTEENAEKSKEIIRLLIGDDSMFRDK